MRNLILIILFFGILACKENKPKENLVTKIESSEKIEIKKADTLLKTELSNLLNESYEKRSFDSLNLFFRKWKTESEKIEPEINDSLTSNLYQIFYEIYHPFELEKYGWMKRKHFKEYKYAIPPSSLPYTFGTKIDTLKEFYPKNNFSNASVLNSISEFEIALTEFISKDKFERGDFLSKVLLMPMTYREADFKTSPEINFISINKEMNKAKAEIRLISTGLELNLSKTKGKWKLDEIKELWIE
ncbi:hypothetical protein [Olleya sp. Hel_I_94]|uniref:hypothetical protein n=1 Tax=Olleya sp. Hel_I_94 TaxID=1250001 RepID=UPI0011A8E567|nr:hypothetical protein [Olleya sp. Hel_I_94]TVZ49867.1 hypothetical protein JM82_0306 [Olleya sp. Hel_I_94]